VVVGEHCVWHIDTAALTRELVGGRKKKKRRSRNRKERTSEQKLKYVAHHLPFEHNCDLDLNILMLGDSTMRMQWGIPLLPTPHPVCFENLVHDK
jgi:hypothetical protein